MKLIDYTEANFPTYALSYVVNSDSSGIEPRDVAACDEWLNSQMTRLRRDYPEAVDIFTCFEDGEGDEFTPYPAFGLACSTVRCALCIFVDNDDTRPRIALPWEE